MSFWAGLGRAMESNEAQRNVEAARDERKASEDKADAFRDKQWANQLSQQSIANSRADAAIDRDESRYKTAQGRLDKSDEGSAAAAAAKAEQVRKEWEFKLEESDYAKSRDIIGDLKVAREEHDAAVQQIFENELKTLSREDAEANLKLAQARFENTVKQQGVTNEQWDLSYQFKVDVFEAGEARADIEFEYKVGVTNNADVAAAIALEVAAAERLYGREEDAEDRVQWQKNMDLQIDKFKNSLTQKGLTQDNWERAFARQGEQQTLAQENVMFGRKIEVLELTESMTKAFSGKGGNTKGAKAPSAKDMEAASINIRSELGGKQGIDNLGKADREFFDIIISDPAAAHGIYAFLQTQRIKENNNINILDLPKYINLAGMIEAKGDPDAAERLRSEILDGDINIKNIDSLFDGLKALSEYQPAKVVWGVLKAPKKSQDHSADLKLFSESIQNRAMSEFNSMDKADPNYNLLKGAIDDLNNDKPIVKSRGFDTLFDIMGIELLRDMGMEDNPAFSYKIREQKAREAALKQERMVRLEEERNVRTMSSPDLGEESSGMSNNAPQELTMAEAESFMEANPDFRGKLRVDGQLMSNEGEGPSRTTPEGLGDLVPDKAPQVPAEVSQAIEALVSKGNEADIDQAKQDVTQEYGEAVASILFDDAKSGRGTGKSAMMDGLQVPYGTESPDANVDKSAKYQPPTMMATELNTPAVREALSKVPEEVQQAIVSVVTKGSPEDIEQAKQDVTQEYGEAVASILFDDAKSGRGTGKSAMMDGLQ